MEKGYTGGNNYLELIDLFKGLGRVRLVNPDNIPGSNARIYLGVDPTFDSLHIGHVYMLLCLRLLQERGMAATVLIGNFTAKIGDPTDRLSQRPDLSSERIGSNTESLIEQVRSLVPGVRIVLNGDWLEDLSISNFLSLAGNVSVNRLLKVDYYSRRIAMNRKLSLKELCYGMFQGIDHVLLAREHECYGQLAGIDQYSNVLRGLELSGKLPLWGLLFNLITDREGKKFSKSGSSNGPFWSLKYCNHLEFWKYLNGARDFKWMAKLLGYPSWDGFVRDTMSKRGCTDLSGFSHDAILIDGGQGLVRVLTTYLGVKNNGSAKSLIREGAVRINDRRVEDFNPTLRHGDRLTLGSRSFKLILYKQWTNTAN